MRLCEGFFIRFVFIFMWIWRMDYCQAQIVYALFLSFVTIWNEQIHQKIKLNIKTHIIINALWIWGFFFLCFSFIWFGRKIVNNKNKNKSNRHAIESRENDRIGYKKRCPSPIDSKIRIIRQFIASEHLFFVCLKVCVSFTRVCHLE